MRLTPLSPACGPHRSGKLYAWRFNAAPKSGLSSPGARAGAGSAWAESDREDRSLPPGGPETGLSTRASNGSTLPEGSAKPRHRAGKSGLSDFAPSRLQRFGIRVAPGRILMLPRLVPQPRGIRRRVDPVPKSPLRRRPFGLCLEGANPRFDVWKMRCRSDSGNCEPPDLSTFGVFASGQGWITQRFGAAARITLGRAARGAANGAR